MGRRHRPRRGRLSRAAKPVDDARLIDWGGGRVGTEHFGLHVIVRRRFRAASGARPRPEDRWLHFLAEAEGWRAEPPLHHSRPLEAAMTLRHSIRADPKERALLDAYNKRLSIDATITDELAEARAEAKAERARAEAMVQRAEAELQRAEEEHQRPEEERHCAEVQRRRAEALAEEERQRADAAVEEERQRADAAVEEERQRAHAAVEALRAKLRAAGIDPDAKGAAGHRCGQHRIHPERLAALPGRAPALRSGSASAAVRCAPPRRPRAPGAGFAALWPPRAGRWGCGGDNGQCANLNECGRALGARQAGQRAARSAGRAATEGGCPSPADSRRRPKDAGAPSCVDS